MTAEAFSDRSSRRNPLLLPVRFLLYWAIKALVLLFLGIRFLLRPALVRYGLVILLVAGAVAWKALGSPAFLPWSSASGGDRGAVSTAVTAQLPQPAAVERYMKAQAEYNASDMWDTMSDKLKQRMLLTSNSPEKLQRDLDASRQQQRRYTAVTYVGGVTLDGGRNGYFYVLTVDGPNGTSRLPYTFVVDQDGKISNIQWSMDQ